MEDKKCKDCGSDDIFVEITRTHINEVTHQCFDCYVEETEKYKNVQDVD
jgi:uncharacterized Zn finger protein